MRWQRETGEYLGRITTSPSRVRGDCSVELYFWWSLVTDCLH
jgi:hypothetical protein